MSQSIGYPVIMRLMEQHRVFGRRYREVVRGWESSLSAGGTNDRR